MAGETILIIDAGQDIDERMTTALEAEGYLSYSVSNQDVNAQIADLLKPSLIYIRPSDLRPAGLAPCKSIHGIPLLIKVPVVILADLKKPPGPHYLEEYGIVDFLQPTFSTEELIKKTIAILGENSPSHLEKTPALTQAKTSASHSDLGGTPHFAQSGVEEPEAWLPAGNVRNKRSAVVLTVVSAMVMLGIAGAASMVYQCQKVTPLATAKIPARVTISAPKTEVKPQSPPAGADAAKIPADGPQNSLAVTMTTPSALAPAVQLTPHSENDSQPLQVKGSAESDSTQQTAKTSSLKPLYSVQLGAFRDAGTAEAVTKKFQEKGYDAFTQPGVTKDRSRIYRVLVDKYEDRRAAQKMAGEIQTKEQVKTTLYSE